MALLRTLSISGCRVSGSVCNIAKLNLYLQGKEISAADVAQELNARYVVEGSVRKAGNRVRINVQLIDGQTDWHLGRTL